MDAHNGCVEAQNGALEGLHSTDQWSQIPITMTGAGSGSALKKKVDPDPH